MPLRLPESTPVQNAMRLDSEPQQWSSDVTAWIQGLRRVASLLAPPQDDDIVEAIANREH